MSEESRTQGTETSLKTADFPFTRPDGTSYSLKLTRTADTQEQLVRLYDSSGNELGGKNLPVGISWEVAQNYVNEIISRIVLKGPEGINEKMW